MRSESKIVLLITFGLTFLIFSCAPAPSKREAPIMLEDQPARIESIRVIAAPRERGAIVEIANSKRVPYTVFKLVQPVRLIVDITAVPAPGLSRPKVTEDQIIKVIQFERMKDKPTDTRVVATLSQDMEYDVQEKGGTIRVLLTPKEPVEKVKAPVFAAKKEEVPPTKPRLFFSAGKAKLNQILGIDFFMLPKGKSRIIVTTSKKAKYELSPKNSFTLLLRIKEATIPRELTRYIDSSYFEGAVNRISPIARVTENRVDLEVELKEMVPHQITQTDTEIRLDFDKTSVRPPARRITAALLAMALEKREGRLMPGQRLIGAPPPKQYTGARITLNIVNADIRNILKLIAEVSDLNIVWGPEVKGRVSMRLKDVPWDQALDLVLRAIDLGIVVK